MFLPHLNYPQYVLRARCVVLRDSLKYKLRPGLTASESMLIFHYSTLLACHMNAVTSHECLWTIWFLGLDTHCKYSAHDSAACAKGTACSYTAARRCPTGCEWKTPLRGFRLSLFKSTKWLSLSSVKFVSRQRHTQEPTCVKVPGVDPTMAKQRFGSKGSKENGKKWRKKVCFCFCQLTKRRI